jgi:hypothetical protein
VEHVARERGVAFGMIYNGGAATSDAQWVGIAGGRVATHTAAGAKPDHVLFQSWMDKPDRVLPETEPTTFTALIDRYLDDPASLGKVLGAAANLALGRPVKASSALRDAPARQVVDGDPDTIWNAGAGPPAWIEIDLGRVSSIASIRLTVAQDPPGRTRHIVTCRRTSNGPATRLGVLSSDTTDLDALEIAVDQTVRCRFVRIDTRVSPSWVAWREFEIIRP